MDTQIPIFVSIVFILTTLITLFLFAKSKIGSKKITLIIIGWLGVQGILAFKGFYLFEQTIPPRFILAIGPPLVFILMLFLTPVGRKYLDEFDVKNITWIHSVRVPVEIVLFWLFVFGLVPKLMTFEGRNFDIIAGLTAPLVVYFGYVKKRISTKIILVWNFICLLLLINIVMNAILSAPSPFQIQAFDQPNIGILIFPFIWLPSYIVPVVLFSHLVVIRNILLNKTPESKN